MQLMETKNVYLAEHERFEKSLSSPERSALHHVRQAALARFDELGFPSLRDEEWRFTNLTPFAAVPFQLGGEASVDGLELPDGPRLVFVNGHFAEHLSVLEGLPKGVLAGSLARALQTHPKLVEPHLTRYARYEDHPFVALNTAFLRGGAFVLLPDGKVVEEPIHLVHVSTPGADPTMSHPRTLIVGGPNSQVRVVESYLGPADAVYFTNAVTEIVLADNAVVDHYKLQEESKAAFHLATIQVQQDRSSTFSSHAVTLGSALGRTETNVVLDEAGCECTLNGLYLAGGQQLIDHRTRLDHASPHCASHELYKGILDGKAKGVFTGKIYVHPDAQKTDAKQTNQTLLLSDDATINTKPQLEIFADDVKCTHGATVGQLDDDMIFYLRSRGIDLEAAKSLLIFAFANDIIRRIKVPALRTRLERHLLESQHLPPTAFEEDAT